MFPELVEMDFSMASNKSGSQYAPTSLDIHFSFSTPRLQRTVPTETSQQNNL